MNNWKPQTSSLSRLVSESMCWLPGERALPERDPSVAAGSSLALPRRGQSEKGAEPGQVPGQSDVTRIYIEASLCRTFIKADKIEILFLGAEQSAGRSKMGRYHRAGSASTVPLPRDVLGERRSWVRAACWTSSWTVAFAELNSRFLRVPTFRQQDLFSVLKAYTLHRPEEGYCQAQAPIAAVLLMHMPAEVNTLSFSFQNIFLI